MSQYFAQIDENSVVINVIVANQDFVNTLTGIWVETDINGVSPKNFAGIGYTWRADLGGFLPPGPPYPSWTLNDDACCWNAPLPMPSDGNIYKWDEAAQQWVAF